MLSLLDKILSWLNQFIRLIIYPFITPIFVIVNYVRAKDLAKDSNIDIWVKMFLVVSVIYLLFTIGFAIKLVIKEWDKLKIKK